jgi:hypothetical protein
VIIEELPAGATDSMVEAHMHPAHQARVQYEAMQACSHSIDNDTLQRCERCLGTFGAIHAQHTFLERIIVQHLGWFGHLQTMGA